MTNALATFSKKIDSQLVEPLKNVTIGRKLVPVTAPQGFGISSVDWGKITGLSGGYVSYGFADGNEDVIDVTLTNSKIPVYWKDYRVNRRTYNSWLQNGTDIDSASAIEALYQTVSVEDLAIIQGIANDGSNYDIKGLYQSAGNDCDATAGCADFGTYGNAVKTVSAAKKLLVDDGIPAYSIPLNLVLPSTQYGQLEASASATGVEELPRVMRMLNGGSVFSVPETILPASNGLLLPAPQAARPYFDYFLTANYQTEHGIDSKHPDTGDLFGRVFTAGILRVKHANAICKLSAI